MAARALNREESLGLALAVLGHAALVAWLVLYRPAMALPPPPARMEVTISDETGPVSAAPEPLAVPAPDQGPVLGEAPPLPVSEPLAVAKVEPTPPRPAPAPAPKALAKPNPPKSVPKSVPIPPKAPPRSTGKHGASVLDPSFSDGISAGVNGKSNTPPASITGPVRSSLVAAISRQLKPKWRGRAPSGIDAEKLVTVLTWDLNPDGTLNGTPRLVRQEGITPANRPQAARHVEEAIRAVRLAAPFTLPPEYYAGWKHVASFRFDRSLGQ